MAPGICDTCLDELGPEGHCPSCNSDRLSDLDAQDVLPPGAILADKYRIGRLLGRGGFGATYLAWDLDLQIRVAIKEFLPRQLSGRTSSGMGVQPFRADAEAFEAGLAQFLEEARILARFRDFFSVVSVLAFFSANGTGYVVMEYLSGQTLDRYVASVGRLGPREALQVLIPVADALRACHAEALIHRDISPDNILLTRDGRVKLLDFGAARFALGSRSTNMSVILKEGFAPFEQYQRNGVQGPWTDVYAFSATLYRLLTGELPPSAPDRIGGEKVPPLAERHVDASRALQGLLDRGMAIAHTDRYQTVDALLADLLALPELGGEAMGKSDQSAFAAAHRGAELVRLVPQKYRRPALAAATVAALGLAGTLTYAAVGLSPATSRAGAEARPAPSGPHYAGGSVSSMRESVRQAAQSRLQFELAQTQIDDALDSIAALEKISAGSRNYALIKSQEDIRDSAISDRDRALSKYLERVEWLAAHDKSLVDGALRLELQSVSAPGVDRQEVDMKITIARAIKAMIKDIAFQRSGRLTSEIIISDSSRRQ